MDTNIIQPIVDINSVGIGELIALVVIGLLLKYITQLFIFLNNYYKINSEFPLHTCTCTCIENYFPWLVGIHGNLLVYQTVYTFQLIIEKYFYARTRM